MEDLIGYLENSQLFLALLTILNNIASKYFALELSKNQEFKLQEPLFRRAAIFAGVFIVTKNIKISVIGTILTVVAIKMLL